MTTRSHEINETPGSLAGDLSVSLARRSGQTADILIFQPRTAAASWALEDAIEPLDEDVFDLGSIAVRLVADWSLPRLQVFVAADPEGGEPDRLP
jgi:hypothetical protein